MQNIGRRTQVRVLVQRRLDLSLITNKKELEAVVAVPRECGSCHHHAHTFITAHRINGDTRRIGHNIVSRLVRERPN
jgi:bacterioferritin-associated ferredoxin